MTEEAVINADDSVSLGGVTFPPVEPTPEPVAAPEPTPEPVAPEPTPDPNEPRFSTLENGQIEATLPTGQRYIGKDYTEVATKIAKAQVEASRTISELRQPRQQPPPEPTVLPPGTPDPTAMAVADIVAPAFGYKNGAEMAAAIKGLQEQTQSVGQLRGQMYAEQVANEFMLSSPDFQQTETNNAKLTEAFNKTGMPLTTENLRLVHFALKGQGLYEKAASQATEPPVNHMPAPPAGSAPTSTGKGSPSVQDLYAMPMEELEALLQQQAS